MTISRIAFRVGIGAVVASCLGATVYAASSHTNAQYSATPVGVQAPVSPMVMLTMTKGHMLWREAYNSYTDLNNDGDYETTYDHSINYYGYFEPDRCYTYSSGEFVPSTSISSDKYCSGAFSGNFMNWATMTRIDILRKLLYGGSRDVDSSTKTTLKRALLPNDAHSFAKHYNGSDIDKLTPYSGISVGDEAYHGITICNTTPPTDGGRSHTSVKNPQARFIEGNFSMWGASERSNCVYKDEYAYLYDTYNFGSNGNVPKLTYNKAYDDKPEEINGSNVLGNLDVIVKACPEARVDDELGVHCKQYGTSIKPIGLLQEYGEDGLIEFGLMSGSYLKNTSGGVLRKNIGSMADEINLANGTFISPPDDLGIVNAIERMRIFGYNYGSNYNNPNAEEHGMTYSWDWGSQCNWGRYSITDGVCHSWGDPFAEMFMESLRYFAG